MADGEPRRLEPRGLGGRRPGSVPRRGGDLDPAGGRDGERPPGYCGAVPTPVERTIMDWTTVVALIFVVAVAFYWLGAEE